MTVGAFDMVSAGTGVVGSTFVEEDGDGFELVVEAGEFEAVMVERLITMTVVEFVADPDWEPGDGAGLEVEGPVVGRGTGLVLLSVKNGTDVDDEFDNGDAGLLVVAGIRLDVDEPAVGWTPPAVELELLGACLLEKVEVLEEDNVGKLPICVVPVLGPPGALGFSPPWLLGLDVVLTLEDAFVDVVVDCAVIEELVLGELWIVDTGSAAPGASGFPVVVLAVLTPDDVVGTGTWLELDEVVVVDDVVSGTGIIVRISEDKLELEVVFEKGTLRGRLHIMSASPIGMLGVLTICHFHDAAPEQRSSESQIKWCLKQFANLSWSRRCLSWIWFVLSWEAQGVAKTEASSGIEKCSGKQIDILEIRSFFQFQGLKRKNGAWKSFQRKKETDR
jgi:hypothetical protein